jgi:hypothetical protein
VPTDSINRLLDRLDESKRRFEERSSGSGSSSSSARTLKILAQLERRQFTEADSLIRFHEILLFMRAYPQSASTLRRVEKILNTFSRRVFRLSEAGIDTSKLESGEVSGIAGTFVEDTFSYQIMRWLIRYYPRAVSIDWELQDDEYRLAATWPRFMPLLEEDALVEANVPYLDWLDAAKGRRRSELSWLIERFERLPLSEIEKAELYESLKLYVRWELRDSRATRTRMKRHVRKVFYHTEPLLRRSDVSLTSEFAQPDIPLKKLSRAQGGKILDLARETSIVRYRELYGFTHGDASRVLRADIGRGVEVFMMGVPPERRLPLRAYHAGLIFKNGIPVCYVESLTLFERMEIGFNLYYTFREGESAWLYARVLKILGQMLGVTVSQLTRTNSVTKTRRESNRARSGSIASSDFAQRSRDKQRFLRKKKEKSRRDPSIERPTKLYACWRMVTCCWRLRLSRAAVGIIFGYATSASPFKDGWRAARAAMLRRFAAHPANRSRALSMFVCRIGRRRSRARLKTSRSCWR